MSGRTEIILFIVLLILNLIVALIYLFIGIFHKKEGRRGRLIRFFTMLLCPVVAAVGFFLGWIFFRLFFHRRVSLEDVIFSKKREKTYRKADEQEERNLVPVEEALAVTDRAGTRVLVLDVARRDISNELKTISLTLDSDDSEVSHYGASILQSALNDFRKNARVLSDAVKKGEEEGEEPKDLIGTERELLRDLNDVLKQHVLSDQEQEEYVRLMDQTAVYLSGHTDLFADELQMLCERLLEQEKTDRVKTWADLSARQYPGALSSRTNYLKLYYHTGETEAFFRTLAELKKSDIEVDHKTLEVIRLFEQKSSE